MARMLRWFWLPALVAVLCPAVVEAQVRMPYPPYPGGRYRMAVPEADLRIDVTPKEAEVYVDGYFAGQVDDFDGVFQRLHVTPGEHEIVIFLDGYRSIRERLYLGVSTTRKIEGTLVRLQPGDTPEEPPVPADGPPVRGTPPYDPRYEPPAPPQRPPERRPPSGARAGSLVLRVQPADAEVFIDGERWRGPSGDDRLVVQVPQGRHRIEIRKDGYTTFAEDVEVDAGASVPINVSLNRNERDDRN